MTGKHTNLFDKLFKNKDGKIVIWQNPNILLWIWILTTAVDLLIKHGSLHSSLRHLGDAALFAWAYLEIRSGESIIRRILGVIVMAVVIFSFFRA